MPFEPIVRLPEEVCFSLSESRVILSAVDGAAELAPADSETGRDARAAQRLIVARLWPGLDQLLDDNPDEEA